MVLERTGLISFAGKDATIVGADVQAGHPAPEFTAMANNWAPVQGLEMTRGKVRILGSLPSLNTSVCDRETRRFNQEAAALGDDVAIVMLSMDLPWTQKTWCGAAGIEKVITLSDAALADFGVKYGVLLKETRILRRAIFVVGRSDQLVYADYMPAIGAEPDYEAVLAAARQALAAG
jgi:thiol peroxidase